MDDLVTWLRAQLVDDERVARGAANEDTPPWHLHYDERSYDGKIHSREGYTVVHQEDRTPAQVTAEHIVRWDPARVLAEVDAKRRILELHAPEPEDWATHIAGDCRMCAMEMPCSTIRLLALPYADRPGYREEWRPSASA